MKRFFFTILFTLFLISLTGCKTVSKKIEDTTTKEEQELSKWLNKPEEDLKSFYGQPDKVEFLKTRNCLLYTSPSPRDTALSRMPSSA